MVDSEARTDAPVLYTLTPLTRGAAAARRVVIKGFDMPLRSLLLFGVGLVPSLVVTLILWRFLGEYALASILVVEAATFWLIESRTSEGLHLRQYQALADRRKARLDVFVMCGRSFDPAGTIVRSVIGNTVAVQRRSASEQLTDLADSVLPKRAARHTARPGRRAAAPDWEDWDSRVPAPVREPSAAVHSATAVPPASVVPPASAAAPHPWGAMPTPGGGTSVATAAAVVDADDEW